MAKSLGIDLGSNSLGWAVVDDITGDILNKGVLVFPDGIDPADDSLETPAAKRRAARMGRRLKFRRKMRKWHLLDILLREGMCPLREEELRTWKTKGTYPVANRDFIAWLKATDTRNPYCDRNAAAESKVGPLTLGRALYHICQRRGFKSSRKDAAPTDENGEVIANDKKLGKVQSDIAALTAAIATSGVQTLGQYLFRQLESQKGKLQKSRIRCQYTGRLEHYETEFSVIMSKQGLRPDLVARLHDAIFMQRPLRSQAHLVGKCPLEPRNDRALIAHPAFEEFRMLSFVNNLTFDAPGRDRIALTAADRKRVCTAFMKSASTMKFSDIRKLFKKDPRFKNEGYDFHYYRDDETVATCSMRYRLKKHFGEIPFDEQQVFDALTFFDDDAKLSAWFKCHYPTLTEESVRKLVAIRPREGNANYSLKAINLILPWLRRGFELSYARLLAKMPSVIPDFASREDELLRNLDAILFEYRADKKRLAEDASARKEDKIIPLYDRYRAYLLEHFGVTDEQWKRLYLHGDETYQSKPLLDKDGNERRGTDGLPLVRLPAVRLGMIRNPLVQRSMTTLRRLVNYLNEHGIIDTATTVRIELARNVNDRATRLALQQWQKERAAVREKAGAELAKHGIAVTEDALDRYVLAEEQGWKCLYTGRKIDITDLFAGNVFDIEHTVPRSRCGDDSLANKTVCEARYNRETKKGNVPRSCPNWPEIDIRLGAEWRPKLESLERTYRNQVRKANAVSDPEAHAQARIKAIRTRFERDYWRDKLRRFDITDDRLAEREGGLNGFKRRQLVDTGVMCSHAVELLRSVYPKVFAVNGAATALARKAWGIQDDPIKDRTEHTHHAKDAMVIAALSPARFTTICTALKDDGTSVARRPCDVCPVPWPGFAEKVRRATEEILVKHVLRRTTLRQSSRQTALAKAHPNAKDPAAQPVKYVLGRGDTVRGALHKETFYGCIHRPGETQNVFVVRKPIVGPLPQTLALASKIVDPAIRELVTKRLDELKSQGATTVAAGDIRMPSGVPVNKVRIVANTTNPASLRAHAMVSEKDYKTPYYVTSAEGSNFRLGLFDVNGKRSVQPDNSLDWAQNHKRADYVPLDRQPGFVGYIYPGAMALAYPAGHPAEVRTLAPKALRARLYKVVKFESTGRVTFRFHSEARASVVLGKDLVAAGKHKAGESAITLNNPHELLLLSPKAYLSQMLFEGIHFRMALDGTITFF